jgi:hypothetical protein
MNKQAIIIMTAVIVIGAGFFLFKDQGASTGVDKNDGQNSKFGIGQKVMLYKSPTCGCCVGYAKELEKQGFEVEVISTEDVSAIKDKYGILHNKQSCHTIALGDYFIEGHVPMEAVKKLLAEKPDIDGIGLPRMPSGTPGMPGPKRAPYEVYQLIDGVFSEFLTI